MIKYLDRLKRKLSKKDKWKIYLYLNGQCVAKKYCDDKATPLKEPFITNIRMAKHLVGTNRRVQMILMPYKLKYVNNDIKEVHLECVNYEGVKIE